MRNLALSVYFKVKVNVASHAMQAQTVQQRHSSTLSLTSALDGSGLSTPRPGRFTPSKDPVPVEQEAGWVLGQVWMGAENLAPTGIRSPDRPVRSK